MSKDFHEVNRLARDLMREYFDKKGVEYQTRFLEHDDEFREALYAKIIEETEELLEATDEENFLEEMADVVEVFHAILKLKGFSWEDMEEVRKAKLEDRGGFETRLFIDKLSEIE